MIYTHANFRHSKGYDAGTTNAAYYYNHSIKASPDVEGHYTKANTQNER